MLFGYLYVVSKLKVGDRMQYSLKLELGHKGGAVMADVLGLTLIHQTLLFCWFFGSIFFKLLILKPPHCFGFNLTC